MRDKSRLIFLILLTVFVLITGLLSSCTSTDITTYKKCIVKSVEIPDHHLDLIVLELKTIDDDTIITKYLDNITLNRLIKTGDTVVIRSNYYNYTESY